MLLAAVIRPDREQPVTVVDQGQRLRARSARLGAGGGDEPDLVPPHGAQMPVRPRYQHLVDPRRQPLSQIRAGTAHGDAFKKSLVPPQTPATIGAEPS